MRGDTSLESASGDFDAGSLGGTLGLKTASGDVLVRRIGGDADLKVASGDIEIDEALASVEVKSASGDLRVGCAHAGRVRAQTVSGDVTIGVAEGVGAFLDVTTVTGDTRCTLPLEESSAVAGSALEIVARTVSGDVGAHKAAS